MPPTSVSQDEGLTPHRTESSDLESLVVTRLSCCMALGVDTGTCFHLIGSQGVARTPFSELTVLPLILQSVLRAVWETMVLRTLKYSTVCSFL